MAIVFAPATPFDPAASYGAAALAAQAASRRTTAGLIETAANLYSRNANQSADRDLQVGLANAGNSARYALGQDQLAFARQDRARDAEEFAIDQANRFGLQQQRGQIESGLMSQRAALDAWENSQAITFEEQAKMARMQAALDYVRDDPQLTDEMRLAAKLQLSSGIDYYRNKMNNTASMENEARTKALMQESEMMSILTGTNDEMAANLMRKFERVIEDPNGSGRKKKLVFDPFSRKGMVVDFDDGGSERAPRQLDAPGKAKIFSDILKTVRGEDQYIDDPAGATAEARRRYAEVLAVVEGGVDPAGPPPAQPSPEAFRREFKPFDWNSDDDNKRLRPEQLKQKEAVDAVYRGVRDDPQLPAGVKDKILRLMRKRQDILAKGGGFEAGLTPEQLRELIEIEREINAMPRPAAYSAPAGKDNGGFFNNMANVAESLGS